MITKTIHVESTHQSLQLARRTSQLTVNFGHGQSSGGRGDPFRVAPAVEAKEPHGELKSQSRYTRYPHEQRREL